MLDKIDEERGPVMADRALAYLRRVMSWHATRDDDFRSPITRGMARTKPKEQARDRALADDELRAIWRATEDRQRLWPVRAPTPAYGLPTQRGGAHAPW